MQALIDYFVEECRSTLNKINSAARILRWLNRNILSYSSHTVLQKLRNQAATPRHTKQ